MRKKVKQLSQHVEKQEDLYRDLISSRDAREEEYQAIADENDTLKNKRAVAKDRIRELENEFEGVKNKLIEGEFLDSGNLVLDVGSLVQRIQEYSGNYAGELASLRVENEELRDTLTKETDKFEEISAEYYNRVSQMN